MRDESQLVLDAIAGRRPNSKGQIRANCPFCEMVVHKIDRKQCLSMSVNSGYWKCYRCDSDGRLGSSEMPHDISTLAAKPKEEAPPVNLPEGFIPLYRPEGQTSIACGPARFYLRKHRIGVTPEILEAAKIGACVRGSFAGRVVVPIYKGGKLAGYVGRAWKKKHPMPYRYSAGFSRSDTLYNEDALYVTSDTPAIIVEGVFDTYPFFPDGVAMLGKPSPPQIDMLLNARRPLLIVFDGDAHRSATAIAMGLRLAGKRAAALRLPPGVDPDEVAEHVKRKAIEVFATPGDQHGSVG